LLCIKVRNIWDRRTSSEKVWEDNNKYALAFEEHVRRVLKTNEQYLAVKDTDILFKTADNNMYRQKMHQSQSVRSSIVKTMDAMTNDRPYRQAMTEDEAIKELLRCAGAQFDATLMEVFIALHTEMKSSG